MASKLKRAEKEVRVKKRLEKLSPERRADVEEQLRAIAERRKKLREARRAANPPMVKHRQQTEVLRVQHEQRRMMAGDIDCLFTWPFDIKVADTLVMASLTACGERGSGTLLALNGAPFKSSKLSTRTNDLERLKLTKGFCPTGLGWRLLWKFARQHACFPGEIEAQLRHSSGKVCNGSEQPITGDSPSDTTEQTGPCS
jgi:hypothetical protein